MEAAMSAAPISVVAIRHLDGKSSVKAFIDLQVGGLTIKGCKIVQQDGQKAWLAMPATKLTHGWVNTVEISSRLLRDRLTEVAVAAWEQSLQRQPEAVP
jgi:DNA-binding cell septation regulator SpoVG